MAKKTLWQRLNEDVRLGDVVQWKGVERVSGANVKVQTRVERIWQRAAAEASRRNVPVGDVLREMGFDVTGAAGGATPPSTDRKRDLLRTLDWNVVNEDDEQPEENVELEAPSTSYDAPWPFDDVPEHDVAHAFADIDGLASRIGGQPSSSVGSVLRGAGASASPGAWATALAGGVPPDAFEAAVRALPFFPPASSGDPFGEHLLLEEVYSFRDYRQLQKDAAAGGALTLELAVRTGVMTESAYVSAVAAYTETAAELTAPELAPESAIDAFPIEWVRAYSMVPVGAPGASQLVAVPFAPSAAVVDGLTKSLGSPVELVVVAPSAAMSLREGFLESRALRARELPSERPAKAPRRSLVGDYSVLKAAVREKSAVELVRYLFEGAIESNATDIHLERFADFARVRYRIDGILHNVMELERTLYDEVVARVKILADMDITERRRPQDGHLHLSLGGATYDLRIASVPTKRGEKLAIRLASTGRIDTDLDAIGLNPKDLALLRDVTTRPYGIILATGPVGSGKTTTLYAALNEFDRDATHVATIEDPVEIELAGANQVEVNYGLGLDFATGLRALLRQDPDTLLIGEIRDEETAQIAMRASMTGRMVFSTLHANDSVGAVTTLRNFGLRSHLVASAMQGVIAQRLVRRLCDACKAKGKATTADRQMFKDHGLEIPKPLSPYVAVGCDACFQSGYAGRIGVFEVLRVDRDIRGMILDEVPEREIREFALAQGLRPLQQDALDKVAAGLTSIDEYKRVLRF